MTKLIVEMDMPPVTRRLSVDRVKLYQTLDVVAVIAGCVFIGCKAGRGLIRRYIKQSNRIK